MSSYPMKIAIAWTPDLRPFNNELEVAIKNCADHFPGCTFIIFGADGYLYQKFNAEDILRQAVIIDEICGFSIDAGVSMEAISNVAIKDCYDHVVILTKQHILGANLGSDYQFFSPQTSLITAEQCETNETVRMFTTLALEQTLARIFIESSNSQCDNENCALSKRQGYLRIMQFAHDNELYGDNSFCECCTKKIRSSRFWTNQKSTIEHP